MKYEDPLFIVNPKETCPNCQGRKPTLKSCPCCDKTGYKPINMSGIWNNMAGFLVCGGPSLNKLPLEKLKERGVVSLAVNNIAAHVPVKAWCFSDPHEKFHHGLFLDPSIMTFAPTPKLGRKIRVKENGKFHYANTKVKDCPNTFGFTRKTSLYPDKFLKTYYAQWGHGGKQPENEREFTCLCTMLIGIRLMCYLGCNRIFAIGVDFWRGEDEQYAFAQTASRVNGRYNKENKMLSNIRPHLEENGIKVYNCNPESKCDAFEFATFENAFNICKNNISEPFDLSGWYDKEGGTKK